MLLTIVLLTVYAVGLWWITVKAAANERPEDFIDGSKQLSARESMWSTFASLLTGYNFVIGVTFSYLFGLWYLLIFVGAAMAFGTWYVFYVRRLAGLQSTHTLLSVGDYCALRYGRACQIVVNVLLLGCLFLFLVLQFYVNASLVGSLLGISAGFALVLTVGVVAAYLWKGGFAVSVRTDVLQGVLMLPIVLVVFYLPITIDSWSVPVLFDQYSMWMACALAVLQCFSLLGQAESFQRVFAVKDKVALRRGLLQALGLLVLVAGSIAYVGITLKVAGGEVVDPNTLFATGLLPLLPGWLQAVLTVALIAAFMGTIDSSAFAFGVLAARMAGMVSPTAARVRVFLLGGVALASLCAYFWFTFLTAMFALISLVAVVGLLTALVTFFTLSRSAVFSYLTVAIVTFVVGLWWGFVTENPLSALVPLGFGLGAMLVTLVLPLFSRCVLRERF